MRSGYNLNQKWRPSSLRQVCGHTVQVDFLLKTLIKQQIAPAYLFSGPRGTGKTSLARIFAQVLLCKTPQRAEACNNCDICLAFKQSSLLDFIEIDAASRTKVEETKELLDSVKYLPAAAKYKIYLIDEVHMLSSHSFNALLKTLEEPPEHVRFLLATTEIDKLPITILSRCMRLQLNKISTILISEHLLAIAAAEQIKLKQAAAVILAQQADGSLRDAIGLLEQSSLLAADGEIDANVVLELTGSCGLLDLVLALGYLASNRVVDFLNWTQSLGTRQPNFQNLYKQIIYLVHRCILLQMQIRFSANYDGGSSDLPQNIYPAAEPEILSIINQAINQDIFISQQSSEIKFYIAFLVANIEAAWWQHIYQLLITAQKELAQVAVPEITLDLLLAKVLAFNRSLGLGFELPKFKITEVITTKSEPISPPEEAAWPTWAEILVKLELNSFAYATAEDLIILKWTPELGVIEFGIKASNELLVNQDFKQQLTNKLQKILSTDDLSFGPQSHELTKSNKLTVSFKLLKEDPNDNRTSTNEINKAYTSLMDQRLAAEQVRTEQAISSITDSEKFQRLQQGFSIDLIKVQPI